MIVRRLAWAGVLGLSLLGNQSILAKEPARLNLPVNQNQVVANSIAESLRQSGLLKGYVVDVTVQKGAVELSGTVANLPQRDEVLRLVQGIPGVETVKDRLRLASSVSEVIPVQGPALPPRLPEPGDNAPTAAPDNPPMANPPGVGIAGGPKAGVMPEPVPTHRAAPQAFAEMNPPRMPPYAWPTYAPYNNYSRVGTPEAYPYQSFPFIGPFYPFPKVPVGWRAVKLEWDDGYWWYGQVGNKYNWWKVRFW